MVLPTWTITYPSALYGHTNGRLPDELLVDVDPGRLERTAARAMRALIAAAAADGIVIAPSGIYDTYRPYAEQLRIFLDRYYRVDGPTTGAVWWDGSWWVKRAGVATAAVPGSSNHGWGVAYDVANATNVRLAWLLVNAWRFGFSWEIQSEPWHIRYCLGDTLPRAVLEFEASLSPAPPPVVDEDESDEEDEMLFIHSPIDRGGDQCTWDFTYLPANDQPLGSSMRVGCFVSVRLRTAHPDGDVMAKVFCNGEVTPIVLPADGRSTTVPVTASGLVSVAAPQPTFVQARETWTRP